MRPQLMNFQTAGAASDAQVSLRTIRGRRRDDVARAVGRVAMSFRPRARRQTGIDPYMRVDDLSIMVLRYQRNQGVLSAPFTAHALYLDPNLACVKSRPLVTYESLLPYDIGPGGPRHLPRSNTVLTRDALILLEAALGSEVLPMDRVLPEWLLAFPVGDEPFPEENATTCAAAEQLGLTVEELWIKSVVELVRQPGGRLVPAGPDSDDLPRGYAKFSAYPLAFFARNIADTHTIHPSRMIDGCPDVCPILASGESAPEGWIELDGCMVPKAQRGAFAVAYFPHLVRHAPNPARTVLAEHGLSLPEHHSEWPARLGKLLMPADPTIGRESRHERLVDDVMCACAALGVAVDPRQAMRCLQCPDEAIEVRGAPPIAAFRVDDLIPEMFSVSGAVLSLNLFETVNPSLYEPDTRVELPDATVDA